MTTVMPFGKYRGVALDRIPGDYLAWLLSLDNLRYFLRSEVEAELRVRYARSRQPDPEPDEDEPVLPVPQIRTVVREWYRELARRWHPDREGGDTRAMAVVNDCHERLQAAIAGLDSGDDEEYA